MRILTQTRKVPNDPKPCRLRGDREFMVQMLQVLHNLMALINPDLGVYRISDPNCGGFQANREGQLNAGHRDTALRRSVTACVSLEPPVGTSYKNGPKFGPATEQLESTMGIRPYWTPRTTYATPR